MNQTKIAFFAQSRTSYQEEEDDSDFYDTKTGYENGDSDFYDSNTGDEKNKTSEEEKLCTDITAPIMGFVVSAIAQLHEHGEDPEKKELFFKLSDVVLSPNQSSQVIANAVLDNKKIESFLEKEQSNEWIQSIKEAFEHLKQMINQLIDTFRSTNLVSPYYYKI